ncbi:DUF4386 domain-containing protein [Nostoc parmelioides]|uniref:DUF4386 domain-containing protein n=1 Tax=Nostoc parmelioides FACHB-3921 TaxID=2692909 RepID=A0ABR8BCN0_9NOSO|nr:DUF4386 domain-containing protein [Nostoc parmelioides]MBD2251705.1 DUF4386 domain-containing protein [Nostoc parmelioides FACHB-3921]
MSIMSEEKILAKESLYRIAGWVLVVESLLIFVPMAILGQAINWPQSLGEPADVMLPLVAQNAAAVRFGYLIYLVYSILFWVVALLTIQVLSNRESNSIWLRIAVGFSVASMIARCLGIIRWLVAMPVLATLYTNPATSTQTREAIALVYRVLNDYAGSVGEILGVSLFAALWLAIVSWTILQTRIVPRWLGFLGLSSATLLVIQLVELFGIDLGAFITVSVGVLQVWFLLMGIALLRSTQLRH